MLRREKTIRVTRLSQVEGKERSRIPTDWTIAALRDPGA